MPQFGPRLEDLLGVALAPGLPLRPGPPGLLAGLHGGAGQPQRPGKPPSGQGNPGGRHPLARERLQRRPQERHRPFGSVPRQVDVPQQHQRLDALRRQRAPVPFQHRERPLGVRSRLLDTPQEQQGIREPPQPLSIHFVPGEQLLLERDAALMEGAGLPRAPQQPQQPSHLVQIQGDLWVGRSICTLTIGQAASGLLQLGLAIPQLPQHPQPVRLQDHQHGVGDIRGHALARQREAPFRGLARLGAMSPLEVDEGQVGQGARHRQMLLA